MKYKIYQVATNYGGKAKPIEKTDVSETHYVAPNGDIVYAETNWIMDDKYFEVELIKD